MSLGTIWGMCSRRFIAYVDESGDEGMKFEQGSPRGFVLSAVVIENNQQTRQRLCQLIDEVRDAINQGRQEKHRIPPKKPLHFRDLEHDDRKFFSMKIGQLEEICTVSVLCHKPSLHSLQKGRLYYYLLRFLVERIARYCRSQLDENSPLPKLKLVLSNRGGLKQSEVNEYFHRVWYDDAAKKVVIQKSAILEDILVQSSGKAMGLQLADAVASSFFYSVEPNRHGMVETAYLRHILQRAYCSDHKVMGRGIKLFPDDALHQLLEETKALIAGPGL
jgi:hypothetical protein